MTSGERFLMGLLGFSFTFNASLYKFGQGSVTVNYANLDVSKISNINVTVSGVRPREIEYHNEGIHVILFGNRISHNGAHDIAPIPLNIRYEGVLGIDKKTDSIDPTYVIFNSFTTTDGKVHTADNLNY